MFYETDYVSEVKKMKESEEIQSQYTPNKNFLKLWFTKYLSWNHEGEW